MLKFADQKQLDNLIAEAKKGEIHNILIPK